MVPAAVAATAGAVPPPCRRRASAKVVTIDPTPPPTVTRRHLFLATGAAFTLPTAAVLAATPRFADIPGSVGVKALDLREGSGEVPVNGDQVAIHYYGRLAAKQGWRFDSTYDHKDETGDSMPFVFTIGSGKVADTIIDATILDNKLTELRLFYLTTWRMQVISGIEAAVKSMRVGGLRRVIIPPSQGYQNTSQEPIPPNFFDRQRLFTTIFNPTRLANGEGSTLGTLIFSIRQHA